MGVTHGKKTERCNLQRYATRRGWEGEREATGRGVWASIDENLIFVVLCMEPRKPIGHLHRMGRRSPGGFFGAWRLGGAMGEAENSKKQGKGEGGNKRVGSLLGWEKNG